MRFAPGVAYQAHGCELKMIHIVSWSKKHLGMVRGKDGQGKKHKGVEVSRGVRGTRGVKERHGGGGERSEGRRSGQVG